MSELKIGTKIYYTGDMANQDGNFEITARRESSWGGSWDVTELPGGEGRVFKGVFEIGLEYQGHGGTRFVTQEARETWRRAQIAAMTKAINAAAIVSVGWLIVIVAMLVFRFADEDTAVTLLGVFSVVGTVATAAAFAATLRREKRPK